MLQVSKFCCFFLLLIGMSTLCAQEKDDSSFLAPYLVNWGDASNQYANCHDQSTNFSDSSGRHFLLGDCPSASTINAYYASTALIHYTAANLLPDRYSRVLKDSSVNFQVGLFKKYSSLNMIVSF